MMNTGIDNNGLQVLCRALQVLNADNRRLPMSVYRVLVALVEAGEPCNAYSVALRAGFMLEHGRVRLHEAKRLGVVANVHVEGQGVLWVITERGRRELERVLQLLHVRGEMCKGRSKADVDSVSVPLLPGLEVKKKRRGRKGNG